MLFTFISFIILVFLLLGQCHTNLTFSDVYLAEVHYNQLTIAISTNTTNNALDDQGTELRMGFRGACIVTAKETNCSDYLLLHQRLSLNENELVQLADIAVSWHRLTHYHLVLVAIVVGIIKMGLILYTMLPKLPRHLQVLLVCVAVAGVEVMLVAASAIAHHAATLGAIYTAAEASSYHLAMTRGSRANGMTWAALTLCLLLALAMLALSISDIRRQGGGNKDKLDPRTAL